MPAAIDYVPTKDIHNSTTRELFVVLNAANRLWGIILSSATIVHVVIALELWDTRNPRTPTPSQTLLYRYVPDEVWPIVFFLCGILAFFGLWSTRAAQLHFALAGLLMLVWGVVALIIPGVSPVISVAGLFLLHMAVLKFSFAYYAPKLRRFQRTASKVIEEIGLIEEQLSTEEHTGG